MGQFVAARSFLVPDSFTAKDVVVESDAATVVSAFQLPLSSLVSSFGLTIADCKSLPSEIPTVSLQFVRRSANSVAHVLARATHSLLDSGSWVQIPPFIRDALTLNIQ